MRCAAVWLILAGVTSSATAQPQPSRALRRTGETCTDAVLNGPESDVDCGGDCHDCGFARKCQAASDCASGLCAAGECAERPYQRGTPVPRGYDVVRSRHDAAASVRLAGALFLGVAFGSAYATAVAVPRFAADLYVPLVGPWLALDDFNNPVNKTLVVSDGALQAAGAVLLTAGILSAGRQLVRAEPAVTARTGRRHWLSFDGATFRARF